MRALLMSGSTIALIVVVFLAIVWFGQRSLMYFPAGDVPPPAEVGLDAEVVTFTTEDGLELGGWFVRAAVPATGNTVVVFNGTAGHRGYRALLASRLSRRGIAVFLFDYRGYGGNPGLPHEAGITRDARGALRYVLSRPDVDPSRVVYFGESLGTAVAVRLAVERPPAALVLRSPFTSFVALGELHYPLLPVRWLLRDRYDAAALIVRAASPVLVIAGDRDTIVPLEESRALFDRAREPKRFVVVSGADHNDDELSAGPQVVEAVAAWLER